MSRYEKELSASRMDEEIKNTSKAIENLDKAFADLGRKFYYFIDSGDVEGKITIKNVEYNISLRKFPFEFLGQKSCEEKIAEMMEILDRVLKAKLRDIGVDELEKIIVKVLHENLLDGEDYEGIAEFLHMIYWYC
uniref:Uncharacterized protein n=1 Tax=Pithovirus LCPAC403 TaxID=2506596 RepID=A0A481ZDE1_9VIRU|nr:MAG: hypothetical protein LCPAC403_01930 [Pithovirus LCPAC403]